MSKSGAPIASPPRDTVLSLQPPNTAPNLAAPEYPGVWKPPPPRVWPHFSSQTPNTSRPTSPWGFPAATRCPEVREHQLQLSYITGCSLPTPEQRLRAFLKPSTHHSGWDSVGQEQSSSLLSPPPKRPGPVVEQNVTPRLYTFHSQIKGVSFNFRKQGWAEEAGPHPGT